MLDCFYWTDPTRTWSPTDIELHTKPKRVAGQHTNTRRIRFESMPNVTVTWSIGPATSPSMVVVGVVVVVVDHRPSLVVAVVVIVISTPTVALRTFVDVQLQPPVSTTVRVKEMVIAVLDNTCRHPS